MTTLQYGNCTIDNGSKKQISVSIWDKALISYIDSLKDPYYFWKTHGQKIITDLVKYLDSTDNSVDIQKFVLKCCRKGSLEQKTKVNSYTQVEKVFLWLYKECELFNDHAQFNRHVRTIFRMWGTSFIRTPREKQLLILEKSILILLSFLCKSTKI